MWTGAESACRLISPKRFTPRKKKYRKQITMITLKKFSSLLSAISTSVEYTEIVRTTFVGAFTDLSTALNELGADWDFTRIDQHDSTMYDIYGTYCNSEFRINVTCVWE